MKQYVNDILDLVSKRDPDQAHFKNTVEEVLTSVVPLLEKHPEYKAHKILERMIEPERVISFRVPWVDDKGEIQVNRGYRVQMSSAMGVQKCADGTSHRRRQRRLGLRSARQVGQRGDEVLPELYDGTLPPHRTECRCPRR